MGLDSRPRSRAVPALPVWALLLVLALLPSAGLALFASREAGTRADIADRAAQAEEHTRRAADLMDFVFALSQERVASQTTSQAALLGVDERQASKLIGFDLVGRRDECRRRTDQVMSRFATDVLAAHSGTDRLRERVDSARRTIEQQAHTPLRGQNAFDGILTDASLATREELDSVTEVAGGVDGGQLTRTLNGLAAVADAFQAGQAQTAGFAEAVFALSGAGGRGELRAETESYSNAARALDNQRDPVVASGWKTMRNRPELERLNAAMTIAVDNPSKLLEHGLEPVAHLFADLFHRGDLFASLFRDTNKAAVELARATHTKAMAAHRDTVIVSVVVGSLAFVLVVVVAWVISRPLYGLAAKARRVVEGSLEEARFSRRGPREVRVVASALGEMVSNLRRVEAQADALAEGDLGNHVLDASVPGRLGKSLHMSVERLSRSLREQEALREQLAHQASHDALTGLPNRKAAIAAAEHALARAARSGSQIALLFLDLDGFKQANDNHGHATGDQILEVTGRRLVEVVRAGDVVTRLGGDEFVVIAEPVDGVEQALEIGQRMIAAVSQPVDLGGQVVRIGASVGLAMSHDGGETSLELLHDADQAVYRPKRYGRGRVELFDDALHRELMERAEIEKALRIALADNQLRLHYQPVVDASTGRLRGMEALVRWERPGHGLVPPSVFVPVAEQCDLVIDLGRWVLLEATRQLAAWSWDPSFESAHVAVNISGRHLLNRSIVDDVRSALERSGLAPQRLVLEITETVMLSDLDVAAEHLEQLQKLGCRVAIDDFGSGYTSISQLGRLPVDILKIDRQFVSALGHGEQCTIVQLMVEVAHTLGLGLVAEGVENPVELHTLQHLACDDVQGFLIARPLPPDQVAAWASSRTDALGREGCAPLIASGTASS